MSEHLVGSNDLSMLKFVGVFGLLAVKLDIHLQNEWMKISMSF